MISLPPTVSVLTLLPLLWFGQGAQGAQDPMDGKAQDAPGAEKSTKEAALREAERLLEPADEPAVDQHGVPIELPLDQIPLEELSGEERKIAEEMLHARLEEEYFLSSDGNGNGWISYREGAASLRMDRNEFFRFDLNEDGRINRDEFQTRYRESVETTGSFRPPESKRELFESAEGSPLAYDFNGTGKLEEGEVNAFLADKGIAVPSAALFAMLDEDRSGSLEEPEFEDIIATLTPLLPQAGVPLVTALPPEGLPGLMLPPFGMDPLAPPKSILDLFGTRTPRDEALGNAPMPDLIAGPIDHFHRLDYDGDGWIDEGDLSDLLRPAHSDVRASAVLAALDTDGDRRLSKAEFDACLAPSPR